jgi:hypothetical protein
MVMVGREGNGKGWEGKGRDEIDGDGGKGREERGGVIVCHAINTEKLGKSGIVGSKDQSCCTAEL